MKEHTQVTPPVAVSAQTGTVCPIVHLVTGRFFIAHPPATRRFWTYCRLTFPYLSLGSCKSSPSSASSPQTRLHQRFCWPPLVGRRASQTQRSLRPTASLAAVRCRRGARAVLIRLRKRLRERERNAIALCGGPVIEAMTTRFGRCNPPNVSG